MADDLTLGGRVDPNLLKSVEDFRASIRGLDLLFKQNKISTSDLKVAAEQLGKQVKDSNIDWTKQVTLLTSLWHVQERADVGFKSMSRSLREMYSEERLQNRTLTEMKDVVSALSGQIGGQAAGALIGNFQALEFSMSAAGRSLGTLGPGMQKFGGMLGTIAIPAAVFGAAILTSVQHLAELKKQAIALIPEIGKLKAELNLPGGEEEKQRGLIAGEAKSAVAAWQARQTTFMQRVRMNLPFYRAFTIPEVQEEVRTGTLQADKTHLEMMKGQNEETKKATKLTEEQAAAVRQLAKDRFEFLKILIQEVTLGQGGMGGAVSDDAINRNLSGIKYGRDARQQIRPGELIGAGARIPNMGSLPTVGFGTPGFNKSVQVTMKDLTAQQRELLAGLEGGIRSIGSTINQAMGGAFANVFEFAGSLLKNFAASFAESFLTKTLMFGATSLFGLIPGVGSFLQEIGMTAGGGPSGAVVSELQAIRGALQAQELRIDNYGLALAVDRGRAQRLER